MKSEEKNKIMLSEIYNLISHLTEKASYCYETGDFEGVEKCYAYIDELYCASRNFS